MDIKGKKYELLFYKKHKDYENYCYAYFFNAVEEKILDGKVLVTYLEAQNTPKSLYWLAYCYWHGFGVLGDLETFKEYMKLSYKRGNFNAGMELADTHQALPKINIAKAIKLLKKGIKRNNAFAWAYFGLYYYNTVNTPQAKLKSAKYFKRSAKHGLALGQCMVGTCYMDQNKLNKALYYLRLGAKNGNMGAYYKIGNIFFLDKYKKINIKKAIDCYLSCNNFISRNSLGWVYSWVKDYKKAISNFQQSIAMYDDLQSWQQLQYVNWKTQNIMHTIHECEVKLAESYAKSVDKTEYVDAYELLLKHDKDLTQIIKLLKPEYIKCLDLFGRDISSLILPYLIKNV